MIKSKKKPNIFDYIWNRINKEIPLLNYFDKQITKNLHESGIELRPVSSNGLWCCALLPIVLINYSLIYKVSPVYTLVAYVSLGLFFYSLLFIVFMSVSCLVLQEQIYGGCVPASLVSVLLSYAFLDKGLFVSLFYCMPAVLSYSCLLRTTLKKFPNTFTIGEAMIVVQSVVLFAVMTVSKIFFLDTNDEVDFISGIVFSVLSSVGVIVAALCLMRDDERHLNYLTNAVVAAALFGLIMLHSLLGINCILRALRYVFMDQKNLKLFTFWLSVVMISVGVLLARTRLAVKASTVTRKSFHVLASTVFLSGVLCDRNLMTLAAGFGLGLLILAEALRKSGIDPISPALQSAFLVYSDEKLNRGKADREHKKNPLVQNAYKFPWDTTLQTMEQTFLITEVEDSGTFAMTPLYLYCGLACPLLLVPVSDSCSCAGGELELLAGVLATGVGDTAASWLGSNYGFYRWAGSSKTVEGTAFNILSQISTVYALQLFDVIDARYALFRTAIAATVSGVAEAMTVQVDNLVLPIITLIAFQLTWPLCYIE